MEETKTVKKPMVFNPDEMAQAGLHFGHNVSRLHPKMKSYVTGIKNNVHIIDLEKTAKELDRAIQFITSLVADGKTILFVGTKIQIKELVRQAAQDCQMPYVTERWLGGTFTNFSTISNRVQYFKDLESRKAHGDFAKYTKKERMDFDKELELLKRKFEGIRNLAKLPDAVLILDVKKDIACAKEARRKHIPIIGITDTNVDPTIVDYLIPANDDAISSVRYILDKIREAILNTK